MSAPSRVIVVDDHPESRQILTSALAVAGVPCVAVQDADEALARCTHERFACMLLDEVLGEDSGLALATRLNDLPGARPQRVWIVSGLPPEFFDEALRDGVIDGFLEKPIGLDELLAAVAPAAPSGSS